MTDTKIGIVQLVLSGDVNGPKEVSINFLDGRAIPIQPYDDFERNEYVAKVCYYALRGAVELTADEYDEYRGLKKQARRIGIFDSLSRTTRLEDDIDLPIKRCVAALALLGCGPRWSCCGFNYVGQPLHKGHQYGRIYFILSQGNEIIDAFCDATDWVCTPTDNDEMDLHVDVHNVIAQWDDPKCIHYHEPYVGHIQQLEDYLYHFSHLFAEEVTLGDTNGSMKEKAFWWQYPAMEAWVIRREDYV
jgi:hypothetical protein